MKIVSYPAKKSISILLTYVACGLRAVCAIICCVFLSGCTNLSAQVSNATELEQYSAEVTGKWILEQNATTMLDPQTSGLTYYNGYLLSVSDGSAHHSQIQRLHKLSTKTGEVVKKYGPIEFTDKVKSSCFISYLESRPDYEAIAAVPDRENAWLLVTEDATRAGNISAKCKARFANTGSTEIPTLLVLVELQAQSLVVTGVRSVQFSLQDAVGNAPNDGIEGMSVTRDNKVLLGLEKDESGKPRVFEFKYENQLFDEIDSFISVKDSGLRFPKFDSGNHPINGMDVYYPSEDSDGYLIAAARNDHQLWIIDLAKKKPPIIVAVDFFAPSDTSKGCATAHKINNTSLEGVAVHGKTLYLINDPWKKVYAANAICIQDAKKYSQFSPLLFSLPIDPRWFD